MHNLAALTPLGADTIRRDRIGQITIAETVDQALASVAARRDQAKAVQQAVSDKLGLTLPAVGQSAEAAPFAAFWTGPDQWMIAAPHDSHELLTSEINGILGDMASVVEQTDGWCRFDVSGPTLADLFERLCNAPVRVMEPGAVTRTILEHLGVFLWRTGPEDMAVIGPRSSAASLHHALMAAARSIA